MEVSKIEKLKLYRIMQQNKRALETKTTVVERIVDVVVSVQPVGGDTGQSKAVAVRRILEEAFEPIAITGGKHKSEKVRIFVSVIRRMYRDERFATLLCTVAHPDEDREVMIGWVTRQIAVKLHYVLQAFRKSDPRLAQELRSIFDAKPEERPKPFMRRYSAAYPD